MIINDVEQLLDEAIKDGVSRTGEVSYERLRNLAELSLKEIKNLQDQYDIGYDDGYSEGEWSAERLAQDEYQNGYDEGYRDGVSESEDVLEDKYQEGYEDGYQDGRSEAKAEILDLF